MTNVPDNDKPLDTFLKRVIPSITNEQIILVVDRFAENISALLQDAYAEGYGDGYDDRMEDVGPTA